MSNPIPGGPHQSYAERAIRVIAGASRDVELDDSPPSDADLDESAVGHVRDTADEVRHLADLLDGSAHLAGGCAATTTSLLTAPAGVAALGIGMGAELVDANRDGSVHRMQLQYDRMRGVLAGAEGRADSPAVREEAARNPEFAAGLRRFENAAPSLRASATTYVARCRDDGYGTVARGLDHGAAFLRRYHGDLAFHHAVDYARGQREANTDAWSEMRRSVERPTS